MIDQALLRSKMKEITEHPLVKHFLSDPGVSGFFVMSWSIRIQRRQNFLILSLSNFTKISGLLNMSTQ